MNLELNECEENLFLPHITMFQVPLGLDSQTQRVRHKIYQMLGPPGLFVCGGWS